MKVLHVRDVFAQRPAVELHPKVTVVRGMDPLRRTWLLETLGALAAGGEIDADGEVTAHGIVFPLARETLVLLDLDQPVRAVIGAEDLPGHDPRLADAVASRDRALVRRRELTDQITRQRQVLAAAVLEREAAVAAVEEIARGDGRAREASAAAEAARARLEAEVESAAEERVRRHQSLTDAVMARDIAAEARTAAAEALDRARRRRREAMAAATAAAAALEQARPVAADDPTDLLVERRAALVAAEAAAGEADPDHESSPLARTRAALERRRVEIARLHEAIGDPAGSPVAEALERVLAASTEAPPSVVALAMADTWRDLHQQIDALDAGVSDEERAAEQRVLDARHSLISAESEFNKPVLTPEQIARVEAARTAVLDTQDRAEGRFGNARSRRKLEDARREERRILERLGFTTYADYMMSSSSRGIGPANRAALDGARATLHAAEADLAALPGAADRARRRQELLQRRDSVAPRVEALIGHDPTGPEAEDELRAVREPVSPADVATDELVAILHDVGIAVGDPPQRDDVVMLARFYLTEQADAEHRRNEIAAALSALDDAIATVRQAHDRGDRGVPDLPELPELAQPAAVESDDDTDADVAAITLREARWADVEAARAGVAEAEQAVARHREASEQVQQLELDLATCTADEEAAARAVAEAEADVALANGPAFDAAVAAAADAEAALARAGLREDEARRALEEFSATSELESVADDARGAMTAAEHRVTEAAPAEQATAALLAEVDASFSAATAAEAEALAAARSVDRSTLIDSIDWALMSRLASLRSVGLAGSVPMVLDDPFGVLDDDAVSEILDRIARLADVVQVVVVSDRDAAAAWASRIGPERAHVHAG